MRHVNLGFGLDFLKEQVKFNTRLNLNSLRTSAESIGPLLATSDSFQIITMSINSNRLSWGNPETMPTFVIFNSQIKKSLKLSSQPIFNPSYWSDFFHKSLYEYSANTQDGKKEL